MVKEERRRRGGGSHHQTNAVGRGDLSRHEWCKATCTCVCVCCLRAWQSSRGALFPSPCCSSDKVRGTAMCGNGVHDAPSPLPLNPRNVCSHRSPHTVCRGDNTSMLTYTHTQSNTLRKAEVLQHGVSGCGHTRGGQRRSLCRHQRTRGGHARGALQKPFCACVCVCVCVRRHGALGEHRRFIVTRRCVQWGWSGQDRPLPPSQAQLPGRGLVM